MPDAVIVSVARSPIGRARKGSLRGMRGDDLAAQMVQAALGDVPELDPGTITDLMLGCGMPGGEQGFNIARVVAVLAGLDTVAGVTVNRYCASSLQTTRMAYHAIKAGEGHAYISAGVEMISRFDKGNSDTLEGTMNPAFDEAQGRTEAGAEASLAEWHDPRTDGRLPDVYIPDGQTAENVAALYGISRNQQDEFALRSQRNAEKAIVDGFFAREICPVTTPDGHTVAADDSPRPNTTQEALAKLSPAFRSEGTVTAGNCCPLNDGAAALVIMSDVRAKELGITPLARIRSTGVHALSPEIMGVGPVGATRNALDSAGMDVTDVDLFEINEAFAVQVIASARDLAIPEDKLNVHGGAIALGHPFGMTGARMTATLLNGLRSRDKEIGVETMCIGGGMGMAMVLQRLN
ncbi:acetyl-CoA C-acetyltransferase [Mycolicibacterium baixiangningiae]|uniref:acetyl-CoA C-acetyltransferase n=1 Tax=Mycolicibacterium baixiangningiae TaxID=2761578 RepID=UPI00186813C7|nr:acetyl-CoA C-acetyltransferase [Mycolicibacterium baixiangningiae]